MIILVPSGERVCILGIKRDSPPQWRIGHKYNLVAPERSEKFMRLQCIPQYSYMMRASSTAGGQGETDDAKYLSWKLWTERDTTMIFLLGSKRRTRLLM